ncbi:MAG: post-transcriptional regulator [Atopococcus tabaci]|uniref:Post-transcriptional regulator n=1 Tax=Atopococcus tabaci TaxID=269774 RepID=A0AA43UC14_9LACT|nr:post-transcriptional regulator [Atopococcus tabaci]
MSREKRQYDGQYAFWLTKKKRDFTAQGYYNVSQEDIWNYFEYYSWKNDRPDHYFAAISDILSLTPNEYFNYATLKAQIHDVKDMNDYDLSKLF